MVRDLGWTCTHFYIENGQLARTYCIAQGNLHSVMRHPGWGSLGENRIHLYVSVNHSVEHLKHCNILNHLYSNIKLKS